MSPMLPPIWIVCHTYVSGAVHTFDPIPPLRTAASRYLAPADLPSLSLCEKEKKNRGGNCRNWWQLNSYQTYGNIGPPPPFFQFPSSSSSSSSFVVISTFFFIISLSSRFLVLRPLVSFFSLVTLHPSIQTLCVYFTLQLKMASEGEGDIEMSIVSVTV